MEETPPIPRRETLLVSRVGVEIQDSPHCRAHRLLPGTCFSLSGGGAHCAGGMIWACPYARRDGTDTLSSPPAGPSGGSGDRPEKREGLTLSPASILAAVPGADSRIVVLAGRILVGAVSGWERRQEQSLSRL